MKDVSPETVTERVVMGGADASEGINEGEGTRLWKIAVTRIILTFTVRLGMVPRALVTTPLPALHDSFFDVPDQRFQCRTV